MKWLLLIILIGIPAVGIYYIYLSYRIHFKADYSSIKTREGVSPENPDAYAGTIAKVHFIGGILLLLSLLLLPRMSLVHIAQLASIIGALVKGHSWAMLKGL